MTFCAPNWRESPQDHRNKSTKFADEFCEMFVISEPLDQVSSTVNYLKQKHDELKSTRVSAASLSSGHEYFATSAKLRWNKEDQIKK